ncbi:acyltransferase [Microcoleus sp. Pol7_A1]|uniref:acyltransferase n=1 Tax=Microcoleus sp. Pol7_A1 TaxID=2818893 RepID=UPI002FD3D530
MLKLESSPDPEKVSSMLRGYMPVLNGYRGIAILLVFLYHCISYVASEHIEFADSFYKTLMSLGWCGVDAFFVLSGFLITGIVLDTREQETFFINFYARRMLRIFPVYYVFLTIFLGVIHPLIRSYEYENNLDSSQIWYWFYLENWKWIVQGVFDRGPLDHFWSLAVEEQFYLICPALIYILPRRLLSWFLGIVILSAVFFRSWLLLTPLLTPTLALSIYFNPLCRVDTLAMGSLIALWMRSERTLPRLLWMSPILVIVSGISLSIIVITQGGLEPFNPVVQSIGFSIIAIFFSSLLILSVTQSENSLLVRCLSWLPLQQLGTISYGLYVYHFPILWMLRDRIYEYVGESFILGHLASFLVGGVLTLVISIVSWYCLEQPILRLKSYFPSKREVNLISSVAD